MSIYNKTAVPSSKFEAYRVENYVKNLNIPTAVPSSQKARAKRYLYGGMLFPSRIIAKDKKPFVQDMK